MAPRKKSKKPKAGESESSGLFWQRRLHDTVFGREKTRKQIRDEKKAEMQVKYREIKELAAGEEVGDFEESLKMLAELHKVDWNDVPQFRQDLLVQKRQEIAQLSTTKEREAAIHEATNQIAEAKSKHDIVRAISDAAEKILGAVAAREKNV